MTQAELFDIIELWVNWPEYSLSHGDTGAIVECYPDNHYEVEFTNQDGGTIVLCVLSLKQLLVVWKANTKQWLSVLDKVATLISYLSEESQ